MSPYYIKSKEINMKKSLITLSAITMLFCAFSAQAATTWQKQKRLIDSAIDNTSASNIGKRGTITFGGSVNRMGLKYSNTQGSIKSDTKIGGGGFFDISFNAVKNKYDNLGLDVVIPISYQYMQTEFSSTTAYLGDMEYQRTELPIVLRPYLRYAFSEDFVVSPFIQGGVGVMFSSYDNGNRVNDTTFMYTFGGGIEFQLWKKLAITPKFTYTGIAGESNTWSRRVDLENDMKISLEAAVQLTRGWAFVAEYSYDWGNNASADWSASGFGIIDRDCDVHLVRVGFRYGF